MGIMFFIYLLGAFDLWFFYDFLRNLKFQRRFQKKWTDAAIFLGFFLVNVVISSFHIVYVNFFCTIFFNIIFGCIVYKGKRLSILFYGLVFFLIVAAMEMIAASAYAGIKGETIVQTQAYSMWDTPVIIIITKLLTYLLLLIVECNLKKKEIFQYSHLIKKAFFLPIASLCLCVGIPLEFSGHSEVLIIGSGLLLLANILVFYCFEEMAEAQEKNKQYEYLKTQNEMRDIYYKRMEEINQEHRKYVHNLKDYLQTIGGLAVKGNNEDILNVLGGMEVEVDSIRDKNYTGNSILNALLCEKESIARKKGIEIQIESHPEIGISFVENKDLIVMIGNLLDNAIEAAEECTNQKEIRMDFSQEQENFILIQMENTYSGVRNREGQRFLTTKQNKENHGLGIQSVEEAAEKYGGMLLLEQQDNRFSVILTLSKTYHKEV